MPCRKVLETHCEKHISFSATAKAPFPIWPPACSVASLAAICQLQKKRTIHGNGHNSFLSWTTYTLLKSKVSSLLYIAKKTCQPKNGSGIAFYTSCHWSNQILARKVHKTEKEWRATANLQHRAFICCWYKQRRYLQMRSLTLCLWAMWIIKMFLKSVYSIPFCTDAHPKNVALSKCDKHLLHLQHPASWLL